MKNNGLFVALIIAAFILGLVIAPLYAKLCS